MIVMLFWLKLRDESLRAVHDEMTAHNRRLAEATPGFVSWEDHAGPGGEILGIVHFENDEALVRWREHPDHVAAHNRAREEVYASTKVEICEVVRDARFAWEGAAK
jgi:heme-degrading monooxygenase HmoA